MGTNSRQSTAQSNWVRGLAPNSLTMQTQQAGRGGNGTKQRPCPQRTVAEQSDKRLHKQCHSTLIGAGLEISPAVTVWCISRKIPARQRLSHLPDCLLVIRRVDLLGEHPPQRQRKFQYSRPGNQPVGFFLVIQPAQQSAQSGQQSGQHHKQQQFRQRDPHPQSLALSQGGNIQQVHPCDQRSRCQPEQHQRCQPGGCTAAEGRKLFQWGLPRKYGGFSIRHRDSLPFQCCAAK